MMREDIFTYLTGELSEVIEPIAWGYYHAESVSSRAAQASPQPFSPLALLKSELGAMAAKLMLQDSVISSKQLDLLEAIALLPGDALERDKVDRESPSNALMHWQRKWEEEGSLRQPDRLDSVFFATLFDHHHHSHAAALVRQTFLRFALLCAAIEPEPSPLRATFLWKWHARTWETKNPKIYSNESMCLLERQALKPASIAPPVDVEYDVASRRIDRDVDSLLFQLNAMVGLNLVKAQINLWVARAREQDSWAPAVGGFNAFPGRLVFVGNEGTGKTSVARFIGSLYHSLGILPKGHVVEIDASALMSDRVLNGEKSLQAAIQSSIGGVLYIKQSSHLSSYGGDFPMDLAQALSSNLREQDGRLAVILACAPGETREIVVSNRFLAADFEHFFQFPDYSPKELAAIFHQASKQMRFELDGEASSKAEDLFANAQSSGTTSLRNAHLANSQLRHSLLNQISRLVKRGSIQLSELNTLNSVDIDQLIENSEHPAHA